MTFNYNNEQFDIPLTHDSHFYTILRPFNYRREVVIALILNKKALE